MAKEKILEKDLYAPVKAFLEQNGWTVQAEVMLCDVAALRGNTLAVVELKRTLNLDVILQAVERQKAADMVYVAVPAGCLADRGRFRHICTLLRRLEIGLLEVSVSARRTRVHETLPPTLLDMEAAKRYARRRRERMCREILSRHNDYNTGGVARTKILTAYREKAVQVAMYLHENGPSRAADVKKALGVENAYDIVYINHYNWFYRAEPGKYAVTEAGYNEAMVFAKQMRQETADIAET